MSDFWENFTYCIIIIERYTDGTIKVKYVTKIDNATKSFEFHTIEEINKSNLQIQVFHKERAIDLMNSMTCNGYTAAMQPYFNE